MGLNRRDFLKWTAGAALASALPASAALPQTLPVLRRVEARSAEGKRMLLLYREGIARMAARPGWDPTSWIFQTNIHWVPDEEQEDEALDRLFRATNPADRVRVDRAWDLAAGVDNDPSQPGVWLSCPHSSSDDPAVHFLSWHRLYIWCFERIVEAAVGQPFRLPYWDFSRDPRLPIEFVEPVDGSQRRNALFHPDRKSWINAYPASQPMRGSSFSISAALAQVRLPYQSDSRPGFSLMLEQSPHNNVHASIGISNADGDAIGMASPSTAARDPIFWLHHVNVNRVWESWRVPDQNGDSRRDPAGNWRSERHHFAALDGRRLVLPTEFGLRTRRNLGYEYDRLETLETGPVASLNDAFRDFVAGGVPVDTSTVAATGGGFEVTGEGAAIELDKKGLQRSRDFNAGPPKRTFVRLGGITAAQNPATSFNLVVRQERPGQPPRETVLGTFSLFGGLKRPTLRAGQSMPHQHGDANKVDRIIDITEAVAANPDIVFGAGKLDIRIVPAETGLKLGFKVESISVFQE